MEPLVQWLLGGLILSLLFIGIARWFWTRYDKPSEEALEWQKEQAEKRKERKVWESVEMQMRREAEEAEQKATFQQKRIKADAVKCDVFIVVSVCWRADASRKKRRQYDCVGSFCYRNKLFSGGVNGSVTAVDSN